MTVRKLPRTRQRSNRHRRLPDPGGTQRNRGPIMRSPVGLSTCVGLLIASVTILAQQALPQNDLADADLLLAEGVYVQAESAARRRVNELRRALGEASPQVASALDLLVKVLILNGRATSEESLRLAKSSVRLKEIQLGPDHPEL